MHNINLLPWREARREQIKKQFVTQLGLGLGVTLVMAVVIHFSMSGAVSDQQSRNTYLQQQMGGLTAKIKQANQIKQQHQALLIDKQRIDNLTASRAYAIQIFQALNKLIPDGLYLTAIQRQNDKLTLSGVSLSNEQVNTLLENILASEWFTQPALDTMQISKNTHQFKRAFTITMETPHMDKKL